jgi:hypothetical protein
MPSDPTALKLCCNTGSMSIDLRTLAAGFWSVLQSIFWHFCSHLESTYTFSPTDITFEADLAVLFVNVLDKMLNSIALESYHHYVLFCPIMLWLIAITCCVLHQFRAAVEAINQWCAGSVPEQHIHPLLVEDKLAQTQSYVDWMTQLHKTVLSKT